ncbi:MAG TPA: class I SAM-dependent methyltransferase [Bryobacteraceae bacterium]|nr:class I SAM-dependent methyltransferase [Bryobacteraceae bacterium]
MPRANLPAEQADSRLMRGMFHTIAPRYDFITRAFSYGMDRRWKRALLERAELRGAPRVQDLASGTGDFSELWANRLPAARPVAADLTERMLQLARKRGVRRAVCADALRLPFPSGAFDCVCVGYGLRNFPDLEAAVTEIARVTRPGGMLLTLDFFLPSNAALRRAYLGYLYAQGAFWGLLLHGRPRVYTYIPDSLKSFVAMPEFSGILRRSGYGKVTERGFLMGGIGLHWAVKHHEQGTAAG